MKIKDIFLSGRTTKREGGGGGKGRTTKKTDFVTTKLEGLSGRTTEKKNILFYGIPYTVLFGDLPDTKYPAGPEQ